MVLMGNAILFLNVQAIQLAEAQRQIVQEP